MLCSRWTVLSLLLLCTDIYAKLSDSNNKTNGNVDAKRINKLHSGSAVLFADELKQTLERYLFGICPQTYRMPVINKVRNATSSMTCDIDSEQNDLAGRLAALALRAHSSSRGECSQLAIVLANTFTDLARTSANRQINSSAANDANKKRKLSKSQKAKIQAKQRTALAVKKKAAAMAAAAAAKMAS